MVTGRKSGDVVAAPTLSAGQREGREGGSGGLWTGVQLCPTCSLVLPELPVLLQQVQGVCSPLQGP